MRPSPGRVRSLVSPASTRLSAALSLAVIAVGGCGGSLPGRVGGGAGGGGGGSAPGSGVGGADQSLTPGTTVQLTLPAARAGALSQIESDLQTTTDLTPEALALRHPIPFATTLGYDPAQAVNLPTLQASALALNTGELGALAARGFVISDRERFPTFTYGYQSIYAQDLPVFVSADSILTALHKSYDQILKSVEQASLVPELGAMLTEMRARLAAGGGAGFGAPSRADADLYLAVAAGLLSGVAPSPVAGAPASVISDLVTSATAAAGTAELELFGAKRIVDLSQFTPRGHYAGVAVLERYFRAMMWLGRIEIVIIEPQLTPTGVVQVFHREGLAAALVVSDLLQGATRARWQRIDAALQAFIGEPDSMSPVDAGKLLTDLGASDLGGVATLSDQRLAQAIIDGGYGQQRIASQIVIAPPHDGTLPLSASFLLLGQRYVVDSHVFSNVVYDRVDKGSPKRLMPDPLDVAYAALHNDQATTLLAPQLSLYHYASALEGMRVLVEAHGDAFWSANLYNQWLSALRALSPVAADVGGARAAGLPAVAATEAWGRRILNAQLASWAELRHDTILYAKPSYTGGVSCEFPDAYVEPNPTFFARIGALAAAGGSIIGTLDLSADPTLSADLKAYFTHLADVAGILQGMAEHQRAGTPHEAAQIDFINRAVRFVPGCGQPVGATGWYPELFFRDTGLSFDPTIADVHTQPTDEGGNDVGRVLHVGTADARLMVVSVDTCNGPRAYAGLASTYLEVTTEHYDRLTDQRWSQLLTSPSRPADVRWMSDLIVH